MKKMIDEQFLAEGVSIESFVEEDLLMKYRTLFEMRKQKQMNDDQDD